MQLPRKISITDSTCVYFQFDSKKEETKETSEAKTKQPPVPAAPTPAETQAQAQVVTGETTAPEVKATKQQGAPEREANIEYDNNMCKIH